MKTIVLDATQLSRDFMCQSQPFQLLEYLQDQVLIEVYVPASVLAETVADYVRTAGETAGSTEQLNKSRRRLGLPAVEHVANSGDDYRSFLLTRFDERLAITVLPWPEVSHEQLVQRAVDRVPPFDAKGSGYRDSLVWASVVDLAAQGRDVALVTSDRIFGTKEDHLAPELAYEVSSLAGEVELVRDFGGWLLNLLPWHVTDLPAAVALSQDEALLDLFVKPDTKGDFSPTIEELGFWRRPLSCEITEADWDGGMTRVATSVEPDGVALVEYDVDYTISFEAEFPEDHEIDPGWVASESNHPRQVRVSGKIPMVVRMSVVFGGDFPIDVDELVWRRADGTGHGAVPYSAADDANQLRLNDLAVQPPTDS